MASIPTLRSDLRRVNSVCGCDETADRFRRRRLIAYARKLAVRCAKGDLLHLVTIDDVSERLTRLGHSAAVLGSAAGSVFRVAGWKATRLRIRSRRPRCHGREIVVWRYIGKAGGPVFGPEKATFSFCVADRRELEAAFPYFLSIEKRAGSPEPCSNGNANGNGSAYA